ncbi:MAG: bifunctional isocitrate dehydrogenase kinase/phosphatase [Ardenticatenales bacterium]|nr:bifunctional isocitrate dehydrogenase kinase/phosphatase [Ardenticatenales bacterium]
MSRLTDSRIANIGAFTIHQGFLTYRARFTAITRRAGERFVARDWQGMQADAGQRLALYRQVVDQVVGEIRQLLAARLTEKLIWASMKAVYSGYLFNHDDWELAETFFNSITRRIFATIGVDPQIEFVDTDYDTPPHPSTTPIYRSHTRQPTTADLIGDILRAYAFPVSFADLAQDAALAARIVERRLRQVGTRHTVDRVEMIQTPFYRGKGAYLVGRMISGAHMVPLVLALTHGARGLAVDAVLTDEDAVSILFSFARSYFHIDVPQPYDLVRFLKEIMPRKRVAELYISVGYNKHGKTELYRDFLHHLAHSDDQFKMARGQRGMVMMVIDLPSYDMVFKLIKDRFAQPKDMTRQDVRGKYDLVFSHDRAGRLIDAQTFEHLQIDRCRFSDELLAEMLPQMRQTVCADGDHVIIAHAYIERRVIPLDLYIREESVARAEAAVIDYGQAIKDLAVTNIFPGDMLLKNFGVTRHGRVVFYDYDELALLTECRFRRIPPSRGYDDDLAAEPWFHVNKGDIFPEEFPRFLGLPPALLAVFMAHHGDLCDAAFWRETQEGLRRGELFHIFPYAADLRLRPESRGDDG